jgi:hypothetical protein
MAKQTPYRKKKKKKPVTMLHEVSELAGCYEYGNEPSVSIKDGEVLG